MSRTITNTGVLSIDRLLAHARLPLYRNAYALMFSTVATSALGMVYWILAARIYPADIVGLNAAAISMLTFLAGIAQLPFMNALLRFIPVAGAAVGRLVRQSYLIAIVLAISVGALFLLSIDVVSPALNFLRHDPWLAAWFIAGVVTWCVFALQDNVLTGLRQAIYVPLENIPYAAAKIALLVWFAAHFADYGILASWTAPLFFILIPVNVLIFRRLIPRHIAGANGKTLGYSLRQISHYVGGNSLGALFLLAATRLLPVLVTNQAGALANAYFYLPWTIAASLKLITANMTTSFTVEVAADTTKLRAYSYRFLVHATGVLILPVLVILVGAPYILHLSGDNYSAAGTQLLRLLAVAALPHIVLSLYLGIARVRRQITGIILLQGAFCALTLGLSALLLPVYGIIGVGIAVLISECLIAAVLLSWNLWPILCAPLLLRLLNQGVHAE